MQHAVCSSSCATCSAASNTSCLSCSSAYYFTPFNGTCTPQCFSPYAPNAQTRTCELQNSDAQSLNSTLQEIINNAFSPSSNMSLESKGGLLNSLSTTIANFYSTNYGTGSNGCPTCNGNGVCQYNPLYLKSLCECDSGWIGDGCSISQADSASLQALTASIITQISQVPLRLTMSSTWSQPYLETLLALTNPSYSTLSDVQASLNLISGIITSDYNGKTTNDVFDPIKMTIATQIIDSCMSYVYKTDCYLQQTSSQEIFNTSMKRLSELGVLQLWQKQPGPDTYLLESTNLEIFSRRVSANELNGLQITPPNGPIIVMKSTSSVLPSSSGDATDIQIIFWKSNLLICPQIQKEDNAPPLVMSINNKDTLTPSPQADQLSAKISYPITSASQSYSSCSQGCTPTTQTINGAKYFECECAKISSLSISRQSQGFFERSNIFKLAQAAALLAYDYLGSWAFWMLWGLTVWFILTFVFIKFRIAKPLRFSYKIKENKLPAQTPSLGHLQSGK